MQLIDVDRVDAKSLQRLIAGVKNVVVREVVSTRGVWIWISPKQDSALRRDQDIVSHRRNLFHHFAMNRLTFARAIDVRVVKHRISRFVGRDNRRVSFFSHLSGDARRAPRSRNAHTSISQSSGYKVGLGNLLRGHFFDLISFRNIRKSLRISFKVKSHNCDGMTDSSQIPNKQPSYWVTMSKGIFVGGWMSLIAGLSIATASGQTARPFQKLRIPELVTGNEINLTLHQSKKSFWKGATTNTYAYNNEQFWGPTLVLNKGETVHINVKNELSEPTTTHWHGFHIPAAMDGGPHQVIEPGATWSPTFKVDNNAGTYWYHPHAHETTQRQITNGAGGLIIIKDPTEAALPLPRTYGVDDIPMALTSRRFLTNDQFSHRGDNDKYGDYPFVNGTMDAETNVPAQFVRLRILNAEIERGYQFGFADGRTFWVIGTDGGLVEKPIPVTRMKLMTGERVELLLDLTKEKPGSSVDLMTYNGGQPFGFPGGEPGTTPPNGSYLNNQTFRVIHLNVTVPTANAITKLPETLAKSSKIWTESDVTNRRTVRINGGRPDFFFDERPYAMHSINQTVKLGSVEKWTIVNNQIFGHAFHIHDVQFRIVSRISGPVPEYEQGWKDTLYVPRNESVSFIAKFDDFASEHDAFMYHCHMSNHEDGGLMGEFLVVKDTQSESAIAFREAKDHPVTTEMTRLADRETGAIAPSLDGVDFSAKPTVLFFIEASCPCSVEATPYMNQIQKAYGDGIQVVGVINGDAGVAKAWQNQVGSRFKIVPDPQLKTISRYHAERSVYTTLIAPGGRIVKTYPGYGQEMIRELNAKVAKIAQKNAPSIDVSKAPKRLTSGCVFASNR